MSVFLHILGNNIIPIFILIGLGYLLGKKFDMNLFTISKLNLYIFVPTFMFYNLYKTNLNIGMGITLVFALVYLMANDLLSRIISRIFKFDLGMGNAFKNSIMFNNSGNIGMSLITLVFTSGHFLVNGKTPYLAEALQVQIMIFVFMNITTNTIGFYNAGKAKMSFKSSMKQIFGMPTVYVIIIAFVVKYMNIDITPTPLWPAISYISGGLVPMSLIGLGVQLTQTKFNFGNMNVYIAVFTRLILGPALALVLIFVFGFTGIAAQTAFIAYSVPTAVNTALIAVECDNNPDFASQTVALSTVLSAATLTASIYIAGILFPV